MTVEEHICEVTAELAAVEFWSLKEVLKRLLAGDQETLKMLTGKQFLTHDQHGQIGKAYLAVNLNRQIVVTTEGDLV